MIAPDKNPRRLLWPVSLVALVALLLIEGTLSASGSFGWILQHAVSNLLTSFPTTVTIVVIVFSGFVLFSGLSKGEEIEDDFELFDRWALLVQHLIAVTLIALWLPQTLQTTLLAIFLLPFLMTAVVVWIPGPTAGRDWALQYALAGSTLVFCGLAAYVTHKDGDPLRNFAMGLAALSLIRVGLYGWRAHRHLVSRRRPVGWLRFGPLSNGFLAFIVLAPIVTLVGAFVFPFVGETDPIPRALRITVPGERQAAVFLVADNQYHFMDGEPYAELRLDGLVRVARRPPLLNLLSESTLSHFAALYGERAQAEPGATMPWAHLGDFADISCLSEIERLPNMVSDFEVAGQSHLLTVVPGNHDGYFLGNYAALPDDSWRRACSDRPAPRDCLLTRLRNAAEFGRIGGNCTATDASQRWVARTAKIGEVCERPLFGAFIDTSETPVGEDGSALIGDAGFISGEQIAWLEDAVEKLDEAHGEDVLLTIFAHHPFEKLTYSAQEALLQAFENLGGRLLVYVAAHSHDAQNKGIWTYDQGLLPEIVIGSTTDSRQEAAVLEFRVVAEDDGKSIVVGTDRIPAVAFDTTCCDAASDGSSCSSRKFTTCQCAASLEALSTTTRACREFFDGPIMGRSTGRDSQAPEIERMAQCLLPNYTPKTPNTFALVDALRAAFHDESTRHNLVCLSWAASVAFDRPRRARRRSLSDFLRDVFDADVRRFERRYYPTTAVTQTYARTRVRCDRPDREPFDPWYRVFQRSRESAVPH